MNSQNQTVATFLTAGRVYLTVRVADADGQFDAACEGCGWTRTSREARRDAAQEGGRGTEPLAALKHDANAHASSCTEVPRSAWPLDLGRL